MDKFPLYPVLSEEAELEAQKLIDRFKSKMKVVAEETIQDLYCDVSTYIESDSWSNFRNQIMDGFKNYDNRKIQNAWDFKDIRKQIYIQFKDDIIKDLNQDLYEENLGLKKEIEMLNEVIDKLNNR